MKNLVLILLTSVLTTYGQTIKIVKTSGNIFLVPVSINNTLKMDFMIDTGASETSIPKYIILSLVRTGSVKIEDILPGKTYTYADGKQYDSKRINIKEISIGTIKLNNVAVSVSENEMAPLLLGQNVLQQLGAVTFDYKNNLVVVKR